MSKDLIPNQKLIVSGITKAFNKMENAKKGYVYSVIELGEKLNYAKELVPHGEWENFLNVSSEGTFGRKQAHKFMFIANNKSLVLEFFDDEQSINGLTKAISDATPEQIAQVEQIKKDQADKAALAEATAALAETARILKAAQAAEVITGSIPAVPKSGILVIESTAEGQEGEFYKITKRSMDQRDTRHKLSVKDYRFHFYSWWDADEYELDPANVMVDDKYLKHFYETEAKIGHVLTERKRAWYVATCESDFSGDMWKMRQEYPSTPEEAFQISTDGKYFSEQMSNVRKTGRICAFIPVLPVPINTFWDIGKGDMTAIWFHQYGTLQHRFINYYENSGEDLITYVRYLQLMASERGYVYGKHYIPHESDHKRIGATPDTSKSIREMLEDLYAGQRFEVVPRTTNKLSAIQSTRSAMSAAVFDEANCGQGIKRIDNYKKRWVTTTGSWANEPLHDENSHGADALLQWGQEVGAGNTFESGKSKTFDRSQHRTSWR